MRFTVHDSPDYYQLKVSVFNDDRRTELIGETWIALEQIIKPGGGKNDVWHHLNCKGRFAGEIRIELTYYDIRPREEKSEERQPSAPMDASMGQASSGVGGPRQPKPVKRRPLPADPTDPTRSISLPYIPPANTQQRYVESPDDYRLESTPPSDRHHERLQNGPPQASPLAGTQQPPMSYSSDMTMAPPTQQPAPSQFDVHDPAEWNDYGEEDLRTQSHGSQNGYPHEHSAGYNSEHVEEWQSRPLTQPLQTSQSMIHSHSFPALVDARPRQHSPQAHAYPGSSPPKSYSYEASQGYQIPRVDTYGAFPNTDLVPMDDEEAPPPPPVHRNSGSRHATQAQGRGQSDAHAQIAATAPLNIRNGRGSITGSPLSQTHSNSSLYVADPPSASLSNSYTNSPLAPSASQTSYSQLRNQRSLSPMREFEQSMPPSLVPGYEPCTVEDESDECMRERRMSTQHHYSDPPRPQFQQVLGPIDPPRPQYQQAPASIEQTRPRHQQAPAPAPQFIPQPRPRNVENVHDRRVHRSSAPVIQPQAASPDPRTPVRKSLSPSPGSAPAERRHSEIPFSPDSFDAFNPSISAANSVNEPGARYNTPEQAKEATLQHQRQEKLGDGPIIGNDGRIIDPSDHLPTDTWAPEPEQKTPKKGPQVTMRFRHSPQGAQPMPAARRPAIEHSISTPIYTTTPEKPSPSSAGRIRLQKKSLATTAQPASSPHVPTLNTTPRSSPLRTAESNYPLQERENYGQYGSSPTYGRPSPGNIPPPIPGKVPIGGGQEDWDTRALSEEMKRIDIGVGSGQGRQRRSRFGV